MSLVADLGGIVGAEHVQADPPARAVADATEGRGVQGRADALVRPGSTEEVAAVVAHLYERDVAIVPRGGGTGFAGGAVPDGGVVVDLGRMTRVRRFDPELWRIEVEAGLSTAHLRRMAREHGLFFPPDPGAAEQSNIGGNIATNAGGPHALKYGVTGDWVTGLEAVVAPGEVVRFGGALTKDVAGYDLVHLLVGSEGTLGIVTAAWLRLVPAPEVALPVVAAFPSPAEGVAAILDVLASGIQPSVLDYLDGAATAAAGGSFPLGTLPGGAPFLVVAEADGAREEARRVAAELREALQARATTVFSPEAPGEVAALWRWRDGVSLAVTAQRGGKVSEDIAVPLDVLEQAIAATAEIGARHGLPTCSWGHAGDGNLHSTFLVDRDDAGELHRAEEAAVELFAWAAAHGGTVSGEHGVGLLKRGGLALQWSPAAVELQRAVKRAFDPKGLMNPGKKEPA
jgi:glycolate oxidase subunit GlcD